MVNTLLKEIAENEKRIADLEKKNKVLAQNLEDTEIVNKALEKENAKVKQACHKWFMRWREAKKDALYFDSSLQKQIEATLKLQQENAELKEKLNKIERKCKFNFVDLLHDVENESKQEEQLTNAKEIIKGLLSCCRNYPQENAEKIERAEQFLKETEK